MRIAIADDDDTMIEFVSQVLTSGGHTCVPFRRSRDVPVALARDTFDLLILDWNMPGMTGMEIVEWAHANVSPCPPVIMLTSRSDKDDIAAALNAGADDFIVKPESAVVIVARVEAVLRRAGAQATEHRVEQFGPYAFDRLAETVTVNGDPVLLTSKEFALARVFFTNQHRPLSRPYLMEAVWKSVAELSTRTLDMHVSRIRAKLQLCADNGYSLQTVFGYGYRLEAF
ncbi:response regulator transcription factor [Novosphingobium lentum]|uniref:response regulator transcription factor n=1 Tax=Novosphingobium lentum TaxID=145287 RepID=UPI0008339296|nr:response regulator transcription factor [Novosphingobium lentum]